MKKATGYLVHLHCALTNEGDLNMFMTLLVGSAIVGTTWAFHGLALNDSVKVLVLGVVLIVVAAMTHTHK